MIKNLDPNTQGGLVALGSALLFSLFMLVISSGSEKAMGLFLVLLAVIVIGTMILYVKRNDLASDEQAETDPDQKEASIYDEIPTEPTVYMPSRPRPADAARNSGEKRLKALFGTTDMEQITGSVKAMYTELERFRNRNSQDGEDLSVKVDELTGLIAELTSERDQAQALVLEWETKADSSTQEVELLRQEIKEHGKWQIVPEEELTDFFPTISLGDGEEPFLSSNRRQRRLMQRLSAKGYSIVKKQNTDS